MACIVYREGKGTIEHGIECESTTCEVGDLPALLSSGWSQVPPGYVAPEPVVIEQEELPGGESEEGNALQPEVDRLNGEVEVLGAEIENLQKQLELREGIEANLSATVAQLKGDLETSEKAQALLNSELKKLRKPADEQEEIDPVRAKGRDLGIEGWETMHLSTLKKAIKDQEE